MPECYGQCDPPLRQTCGSYFTSIDAESVPTRRSRPERPFRFQPSGTGASPGHLAPLRSAPVKSALVRSALVRSARVDTL